MFYFPLLYMKGVSELQSNNGIKIIKTYNKIKFRNDGSFEKTFFPIFRR